jgi:hypothetical protein
MESLPSGVYIVKNAHNRNWAVISDTNDYSEVVSGTDLGDKVGNKVESTLAWNECAEHAFSSAVDLEETPERDIYTSESSFRLLCQLQQRRHRLPVCNDEDQLPSTVAHRAQEQFLCVR